MDDHIYYQNTKVTKRTSVDAGLTTKTSADKTKPKRPRVSVEESQPDAVDGADVVISEEE
jgi:hypothetical protein